jgi:hypothetical protein
MAGSFVFANYETDLGDIRPIKVQPETIAGAWNPEATGNAVGSLVRVGGGKRRIGIKARSVTLKINVGAPVGGYQPTRTIRLPMLDKTAYEALAIGDEVEYDGATYIVSGASPQSGR